MHSRHACLLAAIAIVSTTAMVLAMRRTSTTFDEIVLISAGARGYTNGKFDLAPDHPPMMQYVYGLPAYLSRPHYPSEAGPAKPNSNTRYDYARAFFFESGNDPERLAFLGRLPAVLCALLLILVTFAFARSAVGPVGAVLAAAFVAFLPDVLAHGGVAYNDVPLALAFFVAVWAIDHAVRSPDWRSGALAGITVGLALGVKVSAVAIAPVAIVLVALQLFSRRKTAGEIRKTATKGRRKLRQLEIEQRDWLRHFITAPGVALLTAYVTLAIIFRGDFVLAQFRFALSSTFQHVTLGHGAQAYLLGKTNPSGFWYFFPAAFLFKTSAALHLLAVIAAVALLRIDYSPLRELASSRLRVPVVGAAVFGAALLTSSLNIGFRYALPILPHLCVLIAAGVAHMWRISGSALRAAVLLLTLWVVASPLTYYPNFLAFISEYGPGRGRGSEVLVDSSLDWGQGLLQLRAYLREHRIPRVYLSYFGSAKPDGYGIDYAPLYSFFPLTDSKLARAGVALPKYAVISGTNLQGVYFRGDPFANFRSMKPEAVVAQTMYIYRIPPVRVSNAPQ